MENLILTVNIVLPIFLVMVVGGLARRAGLLKKEGVSAIDRTVFYIFLPASLIRSLMRADMRAGLPLRAMLFCALSTVLLFAVGWAFVRRAVKDPRRRGVIWQAFFRSNYAIFGIPLCEALFPQGDGGVAALMVIATVPLFNIFGVVALEVCRGRKVTAGRVLRGIAVNPLLWACAIGSALMVFRPTLPAPVSSTLSKLADVSSPLALFSLGATIQLRGACENLPALALSCGMRLVIAPAVMVSAAWLLGFRGAELAVIMIATGSPIAVSSYTMAAQMDGDAQLAAQQVMLSTVLSAFTMFAMILMFKTIGAF